MEIEFIHLTLIQSIDFHKQSRDFILFYFFKHLICYGFMIFILGLGFPFKFN